MDELQEARDVSVVAFAQSVEIKKASKKMIQAIYPDCSKVSKLEYKIISESIVCFFVGFCL